MSEARYGYSQEQWDRLESIERKVEQLHKMLAGKCKSSEGLITRFRAQGHQPCVNNLNCHNCGISWEKWRDQEESQHCPAVTSDAK